MLTEEQELFLYRAVGHGSSLGEVAFKMKVAKEVFEYMKAHPNEYNELKLL